MNLKQLRGQLLMKLESKQQQILLNVHLVGPARGTSHRIMPRAVTEQTEDLVFIHIHLHLVGPARGTSSQDHASASY